MKLSYLGILSLKKLEQALIAPCARHLCVTQDKRPGCDRHVNTQLQ